MAPQVPFLAYYKLLMSDILYYSDYYVIKADLQHCLIFWEKESKSKERKEIEEGFNYKWMSIALCEDKKAKSSI